MTKVNYTAIPQKVIEAKAIRFVGNSYREAILVARRKGAIGEPILAISKASISVIYYPSAELYEKALAIHERKEAEKAALQYEIDRPNAVNNARNLINAKLLKQGVSFRNLNSL